MLNDTKITFRCLYGKKNLFTPEYLHDIEGMRKHPDYEEVIQVDGEWVKAPPRDTDSVQRPMMAVEPAMSPVLASAPKARKKR